MTVDMEDVTDYSSVEVVVGVGQTPRGSARGASELLARGYLDITRRDLVLDVLQDSSDLDANRIVLTTLPDLLRRYPTAWIPVHSYVATAGIAPDRLPLPVREAMDRETPTSNYSTLTGLSHLNVQDYVRSHGLMRTLNGLLSLDGGLDLAEMQSVLREGAEGLDWDDSNLATAFAKAVCLYDRMRYSAAQRSAVVDASPSEIRAWARASGMAISDRGRVPERIRTSFLEAQRHARR